jgi:potassium channel subfamily K
MYSMTDLINIATVTIFGVVHRFNDGFTYGQPFWMTVCSTAASTITNATLIWDLYRTPDFNKSGMNILFVVEQE